MKFKKTDVALILTDQELAALQETWDTFRRIEAGFGVINTETVAGYTYEQYEEAAIFIDNVFRRAHRER